MLHTDLDLLVDKGGRGRGPSTPHFASRPLSARGERENYCRRGEDSPASRNWVDHADVLLKRDAVVGEQRAGAKEELR